MLKNGKCPRCGKNIVNYPALSRYDNKTKICDDCGMNEAMMEFSLLSFDTSNEMEVNKRITKSIFLISNYPKNSFIVKHLKKIKKTLEGYL